MFCDIYSLGRGLVSSRAGRCCFAVNHLQVRRGYRYEQVPDEVRAVACGPLGTWEPGGEPPKLEIVHHHEAPVVWPKLPDMWRTVQIQAQGTARELVPVTNPRLLKRYDEPHYTLKMNPNPRPPITPSVAELLPGLVDQIRSPDMSGGPREALESVQAIVLGDRPPAVESPLTARPVLLSRPADVVAEAADAANGKCQGTTGAGTPCPRRARPGSLYCGAHERKAVAS